MTMFLSILLGLCVGSFLNALIFRLHEGKSIWVGRSQCPACRATLRWFELIPVASFIIQAGRCRRCRAKISWQYPAVEIATTIIFLLIFNFQFSIFNQFPIFNFQNILVACFMLYVTCSLIILFVYDLRYGEIPDQITLPAITLLLLFWLVNYFIQWDTGYGIRDMGYGVIIGGGFFALQYFLSRGKWIGGGDIRLGVLMGLILGWPKILVALFLAYVGGAVICLGLIALKQKTLKSAVPFGVFLIPATFITMFWGQRIVSILSQIVI